MATRAKDLDERDLLRDYLRGLARQGGSEAHELARGRQRRVCAHCGEWSVFTLEAEGTWYRCAHCGRYA